jgi:hypothetical protein
MPGDSFFVADPTQRRLAIFSPAAELAGNRSLAHASVRQFNRPLGISSTGLVVGITEAFDERPPEGQRVRGPVTFLAFGVDGEAVDTLATTTGPEMYPITFSEGGRSYPGFDMVAMSTSGYGAFGLDRLYVGHSSKPELEMRDPTGRLVRLIRWKAPPDPIGEDDRRRTFLFDSTRMAAIRQMPEVFRAQALERTRQRPWAERMPEFSTFVLSDAGEVWVERHFRRWLPERSFIVFDSTGALVARVRLPPRVRVFQIGPDFVTGAWQDEDEVEYVRVYPLRR